MGKKTYFKKLAAKMGIITDPDEDSHSENEEPISGRSPMPSSGRRTQASWEREFVRMS